jgi:hypothetical protein
MSLEYFVLCRKEPPARKDGYDGAIVGAARLSRRRPGAEDRWLLKKCKFEPVTIVGLSITGVSGVDASMMEATVDFGRLLADLTDGELWYEDGPSLEHRARKSDVRDLDAWWENRRAQAEGAADAQQQAVQAHYQGERARDPDGFAEADDWSDVMPD